MGQDKLFQKRRANLERKIRTRKLRRILVVCEGEKTEPVYFKAFPENPEVFDAVVVQGIGYNTQSLVREATRISEAALKKNDPYIETWCVFDKDDFSDKSFNEAIKEAQANKKRCAYSIEAFELKNDPSMYGLLLRKQKTAIRNARKLHQEKGALPCHRQNPVTTVYLLVERLNGE